MSTAVIFHDNNLSIKEETWKDVQKGESALALGNVIATIENVLAAGGSFRVEDIDGNIQRSFDRPSDFDDHVSKLNERRVQDGLEPVKR
ncbi:hypothetical protein AB4Y38_32430 [Paraburkholderia sp. EG285A]|uniref:hypothetical protein n=1 Tax=Paraburkholderia sp. EG285A TaxID=3237009 RepID=UPI0034D33F53